MPSRGPFHTVPHTVHRLEIAVDAGYQDFRTRYEAAVPRFAAERYEALFRANADWDEIQRVTDENAPNGFIIYWSYDVTDTMKFAGDTWNCVEYLMGNHTIAQRMHRHHPGVMLYAPLRTAIYGDPHDNGTRFSVDQPSTRFASFGNPAITEVGIELDRKLATLLDVLQAPVPPALTEGTVPGA